MDRPASPTAHGSFRVGVRAGIPYALAGFLVSLSFGVLARDAGFSALAAIVMSAIVFAGSAQFAALSIVASGGGVAAAVAAAAMMNSRFLPMGIALAPSLPGGPLKRAAQGQPVVDASWAMAAAPDGSFDRWFLFGATAPQYVTWVSGTVVGALAGTALGDPGRPRPRRAVPHVLPRAAARRAARAARASGRRARRHHRPGARPVHARRDP